MSKIWLYLLLCSVTTAAVKLCDESYIENFAGNGDVSEWLEQSDSVRREGKSKANLVLHQTTTFRRAVLFILLNPQSNGAAFAGIKKMVQLDLTPFNSVILKIRGQGQYNGFKFILKQSGNNYSFCNFFEAPEDFREILLDLKDFKPYFEGKLIEDPAVQLDKSLVIYVGIQAYGGVYLPVKQAGVASLEIDWIKIKV